MNLLKNKKILSGLILAISLAYPFAIYFLGGSIPVSYLLAGLISMLVLRSILQYKNQVRSNFYMTMIIVAIMAGLFLWDDVLATYMYPVVMSLAFAFLLAWTLIFPPSLIERFARIMEPDLDANGVDYTRKVTIVWLVFSLLSASISLITVILNDREIWLLYNGFISYVLIGLLMGGEYVFRHYYKLKHGKSS